MKPQPKEQPLMSLIGGKMPPMNIEAEECVLSALLFSDFDRISVFNILSSEEAFYKEENQKVFLSIKALFDKGEKVDLVTVAAHLKQEGHLMMLGGVKYLAAIASKISSPAHIQSHVRIMMEAWMKRSIIQSATVLLRGCYDDETDVFELLDEAEKVISDNTGQLLKSSDSTFAEIADQEMKNIQIAATGDIAGTPTGISDLDKQISGLCPPDLIIVAARPGAGKSSLVFSIMTTLGFNNIPAGLVTLEMSKGQVFNRMVSIHSGIYASKIRDRTMSDDEKNRYYQFSSLMKKWPVHINETANTLNKLRVKATIWKNKYGIKVLFVDYLQLMNGEGRKKGQNREGEISDISRGLKQLAKQLDMPIVALSQLSREVEKRPSKMPQLSDLRESGSLEQDADFVLFLMRPEYYKMTGSVELSGKEYSVEGLCIADLAKSRHGSTGEFAMKFNGPIMKFSDYHTTGSSFTQFPIAPSLPPTENVF